MTNRERERLAGRLLSLAKQAISLSPHEQLAREFTDQGFGFDEEGLAELTALRDWLLREKGWGSKYSERYLSDLLAPAISGVRDKLDYQDALAAAERLDDD